MGRTLVSTRLRQDLENLAFIVNSAPQIRPLATNSNKDLVKMPGSGRSNSAGSDVGGNRRSEFQNPSPDRFIADIDPAFGQHFLDVAKAQRKTKVEPNRPVDDCGRKPVARVGNLAHSNTITGRQADRRVNVTMPQRHCPPFGRCEALPPAALPSVADFDTNAGRAAD